MDAISERRPLLLIKSHCISASDNCRDYERVVVLAHLRHAAPLKINNWNITMPLSFFALQYSFICPTRNCNHQFEALLGDLVSLDQVCCPKCSTAIDIRQSKMGGDLARILREGVSRQVRPKRK
jgi:hypothetical protein